MKIPYYKQQTCWTCGPASMRMALESLKIKKTEKQLIKLLKTNKIRGTWSKSFSELSDKLKLNYLVERGSSLNRVKWLTKNRYAILICYFIPKEKVDHYAIVGKIDKEFIYLLDPWYGENHKIEINAFLRNWKSNPKYDNDKRWLFAIKLK